MNNVGINLGECKLFLDGKEIDSKITNVMMCPIEEEKADSYARAEILMNNFSATLTGTLTKMSKAFVKAFRPFQRSIKMVGKVFDKLGRVKWFTTRPTPKEKYLRRMKNTLKIDKRAKGRRR